MTTPTPTDMAEAAVLPPADAKRQYLQFVKDFMDQTGYQPDGIEVWNGATEALRAQAASVVPVDEQSAFEDWLSATCPSGDVDSAQRQWEASTELAAFLDQQATNAHSYGSSCQECEGFCLTAPAHIPADVETAGWCEYVAGMVDHWVRSDEYASIKTDEDRCTKAIAGIIERRLWALKPVSAPQAPQAVGGVFVPDDIAWGIVGSFGHGRKKWVDALHDLLKAAALATKEAK